MKEMKHFLLKITLVILVSISSIRAANTFGDSLVAWYPLTGSLIELVSGANGTALKNLTWSPVGYAQNKLGLNLHGDYNQARAAYFTIPNNSTKMNECCTKQKATLSLWCRFQSYNDTTFFELSDPDTIYQYWGLRATTKLGFTYIGTAQGSICYPGTEWVHLVLVVDPTATNWQAYFYINGTQKGKTGLSDTTIRCSKKWAFVPRKVYGLSDIRVFSRALNASEVLKLYNSYFIEEESTTSSSSPIQTPISSIQAFSSSHLSDQISKESSISSQKTVSSIKIETTTVVLIFDENVNISELLNEISNVLGIELSEILVTMISSTEIKITITTNDANKLIEMVKNPDQLSSLSILQRIIDIYIDSGSISASHINCPSTIILFFVTFIIKMLI